MFLRRFVPIPLKTNRVWVSLLITIAVLTLLATTLVVRAAAPGATIKLGPSGKLANPANSVIVSVTYSCLPSQFSYGSVSNDQSQASGAASSSRVDVFGFGYFQPVCDDRSHKADVVVSTYDYYYYGAGGTFKTGSAGASAYVYSGAVYADTQVELNIK